MTFIIGNWELGIGNWELGIGNWAFNSQPFDSAQGGAVNSQHHSGTTGIDMK